MIYGSYSRQLKAQSIREPKSASKLLNWKVENSLTLVSEIFFEGCLPLKPNHSNAPRQTCCAVLAPRGAQKHLDVVQSSTSGKCAKGGNYQCFACCPSTSSPNYRNDTVPLLPLPEFDALHSGDIAGIEYYPIKREQMPADAGSLPRQDSIEGCRTPLPWISRVRRALSFVVRSVRASVHCWHRGPCPSKKY